MRERMQRMKSGAVSSSVQRNAPHNRTQAAPLQAKRPLRKLRPETLRALSSARRPDAKDPMALPGMRWTASSALSPANVMQLQQSAGNRAVAKVLRQIAQPPGGPEAAALDAQVPDADAAGARTPKIYEAARRGDPQPVRGADAEQAMLRYGPEAGDWRFRFVASDGGGLGLFWITLANYRNRQRDILIDAATNEALHVTGGDLDAEAREQLVDWAAKMLADLLAGRSAQAPKPEAGAGSSGGGDEEDPQDPLFGDDDGGDDDSDMLGVLAAALLGSAGNQNGGKNGQSKSAAAGGGGKSGGGDAGSAGGNAGGGG